MQESAHRAGALDSDIVENSELKEQKRPAGLKEEADCHISRFGARRKTEAEAVSLKMKKERVLLGRCPVLHRESGLARCRILNQELMRMM